MGYVTAIVSGAASFGVLLGLISGVFFFVILGLRWAGRVRATLYDEKLPRPKEYQMDDTYIVGNHSSTSMEFNDKNCRTGSARLSPAQSFCDLEQGQPKKYSLLCADAGPQVQQMSAVNVEKEEKTAETCVSSDSLHIRELIEKLVETIVGGPLDGITVGRLSTHNSCDEALKADVSNTMRLSLSRLIQRIISEAMALPNIREILCQYSKVEPCNTPGTNANDYNNKSYEDILATAILNKVIENFQKTDNNSDRSKKHNWKSGKGRKMDKEDDLVYNSDWSEASYSEPLSLTIEEHIEEVTTAYDVSEDEFFEYEGKTKIPFPESGKVVRNAVTDDENSEAEERSSATELIMSTPSWEKNWLFQKKRVQCTPNAHHPVPVPMLVPNPSQDFRALVGGVDADDLSDMSECDDSALEDLISKNCGVVTSARIAKVIESDGSSNAEDEHHPADVAEDDADEKETLREEHDVTDNRGITHYRSEDVIQKEIARPSEWLNSLPEETSRGQSEEAITDHKMNGELEETIRCPIAEREKEKWKNPVSLPDNPYSLENIGKREQRRRQDYFRIGSYFRDAINFPDYDSLREEFPVQKNDNWRVARDYYVNGWNESSGAASAPSFSPAVTCRTNEKIQEVKAVRSKVADNQRNLEKPEKLLMSTMQNDEDDLKVCECDNLTGKEFRLPNVRELARQFTSEEFNTSSPVDGGKLAQDGELVKLNFRSKCSEEKEPEIDYSPIPISEIILNLTGSRSPSSPTSNSNQPPVRKPRPRDVPETVREEPKTERKIEKVVMARFNGKQVHSLTARSISKEFREGLKNSSDKNQRTIVHSQKECDSQQGDSGSPVGKSSPTPSIDLKNMKKFWEEIITANAK